MNELNRQISICFFAGKITLLKLFNSTLPIHNNALNDKAKLLLNFIHTDGTKKPARPTDRTEAFGDQCIF